MGTTHIVYLAAGANPDLHTQALYAALSALAWHPRPLAQNTLRIHLFTSQPSSYSLLLPHPAVQLQPFPPALQPLLQAPVLQPFQLKLAVVRHMLQLYPQHAVLFCDADTFFTADASPLFLHLQAGGFAMHRREYSTLTHPLGQSRKIVRALRQSGLLAAMLQRDPDLTMWNSGVLGLPPGSTSVLDHAIATLTRLAPLLPPHYPAEQLCVASAIPSPIQPADHCIFHYWYQKADYTRAIANRLSLASGRPLPQQLATLQQQTLVLPATPQKLHWWEQALIAAGLRRRPADPRGLPLP